MSQSKTYLILFLLLACALLLSDRFNQAPPQPDLRPLMLHTITKGGSAKVVYLERWEDSTSLWSNTDFEIVWPASASQGYIDYMLEHSAGEIADTFRLVGYWIKEGGGQ